MPDAATDAAGRDVPSEGDAQAGHLVVDAWHPTDGGDAGQATDAADAGPVADAGAPHLDFAKPIAAVVYTNGLVAVQIATSAPPPSTVDVLVDGAAVLHLSSPFTGSVPTAALSEGRHALDCRAMFGNLPAACATRTLIVDRTPPTIVSTTPFEYEYAAAGEIVSATFSEPMAAASVTTRDLSGAGRWRAPGRGADAFRRR